MLKVQRCAEHCIDHVYDLKQKSSLLPLPGCLRTLTVAGLRLLFRHLVTEKHLESQWKPVRVEAGGSRWNLEV